MLFLNRYSRFIFLLLVFQNVCAEDFPVNVEGSDTAIVPGKAFYDGFFTTSLTLNRNRKENFPAGLFFSGVYNYNFRNNKELRGSLTEIHVGLTYARLFDSLWIKTKDYISYSSIWTFDNGRQVKDAVNLGFRTQLANSWEINSLNNTTKKSWKSGPFVPAYLVAGYGVNSFLGRNSYLNISLAALKISSLARTANAEDGEKYFARTDKIVLLSEYGFNVQARINRPLGNKIVFENRTSLFGSGLKGKTVSLDMLNIIAYAPFRPIKIRFENSIGYDYQFSVKLQTRYELLFGYYFETRQTPEKKPP
jgi:hypothetical protein